MYLFCRQYCSAPAEDKNSLGFIQKIKKKTLTWINLRTRLLLLNCNFKQTFSWRYFLLFYIFYFISKQTQNMIQVRKVKCEQLYNMQKNDCNMIALEVYSKISLAYWQYILCQNEILIISTWLLDYFWSIYWNTPLAAN